MTIKLWPFSQFKETAALFRNISDKKYPDSFMHVIIKTNRPRYEEKHSTAKVSEHLLLLRHCSNSCTFY